MTHDELLNNLNFVWSIDEPQLDKAEQLRQALRAVVELHKPIDSPWCDLECCGFYCNECRSLYPCKTIEAIEKELA